MDYDDWGTTPEFFTFLNHIWGPFTVDRFADSDNTKLTRFYSKFHCPHSEGVDAFNFSWAREHNYLVPPVHLVPATLKHLEFYQAEGVLVVPYWTSSIFYPLLLDTAHTFKYFIQEAMFFDNGHTCVFQGRDESCFIGSPHFKSGILAMKITF